MNQIFVHVIPVVPYTLIAKRKNSPWMGKKTVFHGIKNVGKVKLVKVFIGHNSGSKKRRRFSEHRKQSRGEDRVSNKSGTRNSFCSINTRN